MEANELDRQMADFVWCISTGLRAGYNLHQVFSALAQEAPEPSASAVKGLLADLNAGVDFETALVNWRKTNFSNHIDCLVEVLLTHRTAGGNLPEMLDPLIEGFLVQSGSDPAFYTAMRQEATVLNAPIPERARK